jgi:hypothetical protein
MIWLFVFASAFPENRIPLFGPMRYSLLGSDRR